MTAHDLRYIAPTQENGGRALIAPQLDTFPKHPRLYAAKPIFMLQFFGHASNRGMTSTSFPQVNSPIYFLYFRFPRKTAA